MSNMTSEPIQLDNVDALIDELETQFAVVSNDIYAQLGMSSDGTCSNGCSNGCTNLCTHGCTGSPC